MIIKTKMALVVTGLLVLGTTACGKLPPDPRIPQLKTTAAPAPATALVDHYMVEQCKNDTSTNCVEYKRGYFTFVSEGGKRYTMDTCREPDSLSCIVPKYKAGENSLDLYRVNLPLPPENAPDAKNGPTK